MIPDAPPQGEQKQGGQQEIGFPEQPQAACRHDYPHQRICMGGFFLPLADEYHDEQGRHDKLNALNPGEEVSANGAQNRPRNPGDVQAERDEKHEPPPVHIGRQLRDVIDRKGFVNQSRYQPELLPARIFVLLKYGQAVEQVPSVHDQRQQQGIQGIVGAQQQFDADKFHRTGKNESSHTYRVDGVETAPLCIDTVSYAKKKNAQHEAVSGVQRFQKGRFYSVFR